ncbi:MAG TPA: glycosyltransferase family 4 protein [Acidimicrobiales bacterium]|nr:glycosyltransferase family 4 protein [Acidimicrobiales bacterium]
MLEQGDLRRVHLDFVDALSQNTLYRAEASRLPSFWRIEAERLRRLEVEVGALVASSSCTTEADRRAIGIPTTKVIPFGVDLPASVPPSASRPTILFPGNLGYFANVDAAVWLAEEILPLVRETVPDVRLLAVGARPARQVRALAHTDLIEVHGDVPSMTPFYGAAWIVAAPLRYGTGLQTKVLEAFAHRRAVVTTTGVASRVPGVVAGEHLETADEASTLAKSLVRLLLDQSRRDRLAAAGNAVAQNSSWHECGRMLERAYQW